MDNRQFVKTTTVVPVTATYLCIGALMAGSGITWADGRELKAY